MSITFDSSTTPTTAITTMEGRGDGNDPQNTVSDDVVIQHANEVSGHFTPQDALANVGDILRDIIVLVEGHKELTGPEKKDLAMRILDNVLQQFFPEDSVVRDIIRFAAGGIIDAIIAATKGEVPVNQPEDPNGTDPKPSRPSLLGCCLPFLSRKV